MRKIPDLFFRTGWIAASAAAALFAWTGPARAVVTKIQILSTTKICTPQTPAAGQTQVCEFGDDKLTYEGIAGLAFGELDPKNPLNAIIQDIDLAPKNAQGKVEYTSTFFLVKPTDMSKSSGLMWHDVPNRGGRITINDIEKGLGDIGLSSGWQGDNAGGTLQSRTDNDWVKVPVLSGVTGTVLARIVNRSGTNSAPLMVQSNPFPYKPASRDTTQAKLTIRDHETMSGDVTSVTQGQPAEQVVPSSEWAWAKCGTLTENGQPVTYPPFPGQPDSTQICLNPNGSVTNGGFNANKLYQVVFTATDPYVLGVGFAAFRDVGEFFKTAVEDSAKTPNPIARQVSWSVIRGVSQSGNFTRGFLHLGFNQREGGQRLHDGAWPIIAGRRIALNFRWAQPDGVLELYQAGSEGPQWWVATPDPVRGLPARGILDRCQATNTCPKIVEHFGAAEIWELKLGIEWVGTDGSADIPLPDNVRRYYIPSSTHGGGAGGFNQVSLSDSFTAPNCPGNNYGQALLRANPVPHTETVNAIRHHFRNWIMHDKKPPDSMYPQLSGPKKSRDLVAPTKQAMGFPSGLPMPSGDGKAVLKLPGSVPEAACLSGLDCADAKAGETPFINPVLDYDWGPQFNPNDASGIPTNFPPPIKHVITGLVPRVDEDANELGGVPVVLREAPLGSYFGWNITKAGFHRNQNCNYVGGMVPFAVTAAERKALGDPRLSLEERYKNHDRYVDAVRVAANRAMGAGFLLFEDREKLIQQAKDSNVLK
jgi:alpha/beta hydrolase family protein